MKKINMMRVRAAFTMIEILVVIAIIAILAAILFPVFATVRESARQSSTMSNMQAVYVGAKLYYEDEGRYPSVLFDYAEVADNNQNPPQRPILNGETATAMNQVAGSYSLLSGGTLSGNLYKEQVKDYNTFLSADDEVKDKTAVTQVYYPANSPQGISKNTSFDSTGMVQNLVKVMWHTSGTATDGCTIYSDVDLPALKNDDPKTGGSYANKPKYYYKMDAMDIGPMLNQFGNVVRENGNIVYELHYTPDWSNELWTAGKCDYDPNSANKDPRSNQLKYKNPPSDRTVLTYVTHHAAFGHSSNVLVLLLSGTARKINARETNKLLPMDFNKP